MLNRGGVNAIEGARSYWSRFFGISPDELNRDDILVVPHSALGDYAGAWVWWQDSGKIISAPEDMVLDLKHRVTMIKADELSSKAFVHAFFGDRVVMTIGPAYHGWIERRTNRSEADFHIVEIPPNQIKGLTNIRACDPDGWRNAGLDGKTDVSFGAMVGGQIMALACYQVDSLGVAFIRVFTNPDHRRRGLAGAVLSTCVDHALASGLPCVYQTLLSNISSVELAKAVGFSEYGLHIAVRLRQ